VLTGVVPEALWALVLVDWVAGASVAEPDAVIGAGVAVAAADRGTGVDVDVAACWITVGVAGMDVGVAVGPPLLHALSTPTSPNAINKTFTLHIRKTLLVFLGYDCRKPDLPLNFHRFLYGIKKQLRCNLS